MRRSVVIQLAKILLAVGLVAFVVQRAGWQQIVSSLSAIDLQRWALGGAVMLLGFGLSMMRWRMLMRSVGLMATRWDAIRLGFIGLFFSNLVPGLTGGDLVKAVYVARESPGQRPTAVLSVVVDRVIGIVALALIAAVAVLFDLERYAEVAFYIYGFLALAALGSAMVLSRRIKARLRSLLGRFRRDRGKRNEPGLLARIDQAVSMYRERLPVVAAALVQSVGVHGCIIVALWIFGGALADGNLAAAEANLSAVERAQIEHLGELGLPVYCSVIPIIMIISALPVAPAGWGIGETAFYYFFGMVGVTEALSVSLSFTYRLTTLLISLLGGLCLAFGARTAPATPPEAEPAP